MSERWKYQIKSGSFFGVTMTIVSSLFDLSEKDFTAIFFSYKFIVRLVIFLILGIFVLGYYNWKEKIKKQS
jgi:hypothetical protein